MIPCNLDASVPVIFDGVHVTPLYTSACPTLGRDGLIFTLCNLDASALVTVDGTQLVPLYTRDWFDVGVVELTFTP